MSLPVSQMTSFYLLTLTCLIDVLGLISILGGKSQKSISILDLIVILVGINFNFNFSFISRFKNCEKSALKSVLPRYSSKLINVLLQIRLSWEENCPKIIRMSWTIIWHINIVRE